MISPTVGRIVWYHPGPNNPTPIFKGEALAAIVTRARGDRSVNLTIFRADGITYGRDAVQLLQDGDKRPAEGGFCEWMPYQKGQAAKTEQLERQAAAR